MFVGLLCIILLVPWIKKLKLNKNSKKEKYLSEKIL